MIFHIYIFSDILTIWTRDPCMDIIPGNTNHVENVRIQRGGGAGHENYRNIGFLSNTGADPLKITKLPIQHSMLGLHRPAGETPFKWRFAGGPLMARL